MKSGFVGLVGRPNVGKSTLLNQIIGKKVAITSDKPQTTRNNIQGIYNEEDTQIIFVDTPGIHKPKYKLGKYLNKQAYYSISDVDIICFVVDASTELGKGDQFVLDRLKSIDKPVILVLNKIDCLKKEEILLKINEYKDLYSFAEVVPVSALKKNNVETLVTVLKKYLPDEIKYYDSKDVTSSRPQFIISELVREKILLLTEEEVPHSVTCVVEQMEQDGDKLVIQLTIVVDRDNLKKIIIGKQGAKIKEIGMKARKDIEKYLEKPVYLELYVKTIKKWRDRERYLAEFGYKNFE